MKYRKKLIEVALPLEAINTSSAKEKSIRYGHPSTLHLWWARRPLASARAVIFAQMVDDPSEHPETFRTEAEQETERNRLFSIIEDIVKWENVSNKKILKQAKDEILRSWRNTCNENSDHPFAKELFNSDTLPEFHDPFGGGGAIPLEAQRLGLNSYASDLNPVAVLLNRAMIEIPPKFSGFSPVNPDSQLLKNQMSKSWEGLSGLSEDVQYYGQWMRKKAIERLGAFYPKIHISSSMITDRPDLKPYENKELTIIACLWARTVKSSNPAFSNIDVPLASTFLLSTKDQKGAYVEPIITSSGYKFEVRYGKPENLGETKNGTKLARGANFKCIMSGTPMASDYIKSEGKAGRMGAKLMAIVAEGVRGRIYLSPNPEIESLALNIEVEWKPDTPIPHDKRSMFTPLYGLTHFHHLFTSRQLNSITTFADLVQEARELVKKDFGAAKLGENKVYSEAEINSYSDAIGVYLACAVGKLADYNSNGCSWGATRETIRNTFGRQAIPMVWDFAEANVLSESTGGFLSCVEQVARVIANLPGTSIGLSAQADAQTQEISRNKVVSTDPPYYDNIGYADLSDFFYVWMRRSLRTVFPELFSTLATPKAEELVANPYRHGNKDKAETFFLDGMTLAMSRISEQAHPAFPVTIYYAFKQAESDGNDGTTNTGWDTFLAAVIDAGFAITGTWPMRTEMGNRMVGSGTNALASSIVLVCRKRNKDAPTATRREFISALKEELPKALAHLQAGNIAPVDLAQAAIGPGMGTYTRFSKVVDAEGNKISVRAALSIINQTLDESLAEQEGDFDSDTRWALTWFDQNGFSEGDYGIAEQLSKSKNTAVSGLVEAGILFTKAGKVRLLKPSELPNDWDPETDSRLTVWEMVHHLIRVLQSEGENAASIIVAKLGTQSETARELCYRLYTLCERKKRAGDAMAYNSLVQSWPELTKLARDKPKKIMTLNNNLFDQE